MSSENASMERSLVGVVGEFLDEQFRCRESNCLIHSLTVLMQAREAGSARMSPAG
jgi:hypothetical protein